MRWCVLVVLVAACSDPEEPGPDAEPAPVTVVPDDDCLFGDFFAECSTGDAPTVLACQGTDCRWFSDRTVPASVNRVSTCPPDDVCCHDDWPFAEPEINDELELDFITFGELPWDRDRGMVIDVIVDAGLTVDPEPVVQCSAPLVGGLGDACEHGTTFHRAVPGTTVLAGERPSGTLSGWYPWIEIDERDGALQARMCAVEYSDAASGNCLGNVRVFPDCASEGTLLVDAWPTPSKFRLDATLGSGKTLMTSAALP